eukprot:TRINITY_DN5417_c0_g1_i1.p2 TRINITY_DN5417_c0_g1~~TRINITY_DN5417_c0_g1_i1.p2  ORF type:complete len:223 (+),score=18.08 TRINITY_DN5417_c0_g1_i1:340-1008(+)
MLSVPWRARRPDLLRRSGCPHRPPARSRAPLPRGPGGARPRGAHQPDLLLAPRPPVPRDRLFFPMGRLCRLHQSGQCKYGAECKNVHVCRVLGAELRSELFEAADPECPFTGDSATDPSLWVPTPTHRPTPRSPLGPIGPAQLGPPNTASSASPTPKWMHDTLFRSFPMLFHTLTRDDFSPLSPGSTTPDIGPSSPWTPHSGGSSPESEALSWNRWPTPPPH